MSPLLGSSGGSSEYAYRGTLDDWPNPFASTLSAQNIIGTQSPTNSATATLTITGLNYKARVIVDEDNTTLSIDGGVTYVSARPTDASVFIRDNTTIRIRLQPTSGTLGDFNKSYTIPVKIGKRQGTWIVSTRLIDETPDPFIFSALIDQPIGITAVSNPVTIVGLETGFSFDISAVANQPGTPINIYKNGSLIGVSGTVANTDQIYLSTQTPDLYGATRTFTVQVGTFTTTWGFITQNAITGIAPFSFAGVSSATSLGVAYTSASMTISGASPGPTITPPNPLLDPTALPVTISGPNAFYEIRTGEVGNPLRYPNGTNPNNWQNTPGFAYNGDQIKVQINASSFYNTTGVGILTVSNQSASYIVTTRPTPIDTIPAPFTFTDLINTNAQPRSAVVTSSPITLSGMTNGVSDFGTATIVLSATTANITPQFQVVRGGSIVKAFSSADSQVRSGDQITLRLTTPNLPGSNGVTNANLQLRINGTDTTNNLPLEGYTTNNASNEDTWTVETLPRTCSISPFTITNITNAPLSSDQLVDFTVGGYNADCRMSVDVTSTSVDYNFIQVNGVGITSSKLLSDVAPSSSIRLLVRSSSSYVTPLTSTITVSNSTTGVTPSTVPGFSTSFTITTVANTTPVSASLSLTSPLPPLIIEVGNPFTLSWNNVVNCTEFRNSTINGSVASWATPSLGPSNETITAPSPAGSYVYGISFYANPSASNVSGLGPNNGPIGSDIFWEASTSRHYIQKTVTISVVNDITPAFSPADFTDLTDQIVSTFGTPEYVSSNTLGLSSITSGITITGIVTALTAGEPVPPTTPIAFFDSSTGGVTSKTFSNGSNVVIFLKTSTLFSSVSTAYVRFFNGATQVAGPITFNITTQPCFPLTTDVLHTGTSGGTVTLRYYQDATYINAVGGATETANLLYKETIGGVTTTGIIVSSTANAGTFASIPATTLSWRLYINEIYNAFVTAKRRPPTNTEVTSIVEALLINTIGSFADLQIALQNAAAAAGTDPAAPVGSTTANNRCGPFPI